MFRHIYLIVFVTRALLEKANCDNENLSLEINEIKLKNQELENRLEQQNLDMEEMKRSHQQTLAENADTIRSLKVNISKYSFFSLICLFH